VRLLERGDKQAALALSRIAFGGEPMPPPGAGDPLPALCRYGAFDPTGGLLAKASEWDQRQWFGGRPVSVAGVAGVAVAPEARSTGLARTLLRHLLGEARDCGAVLASLFATAPQLYRGLGFEHVGTLATWRFPAPALARVRMPGDVTLRAASPDSPADAAAVRAVYDAVAQAGNGMAVREAPRFDVSPASVIGGHDGVSLAVGPGHQVEGYCSWHRGRGYSPDAVLRVDELLATTGRATTAFLAMLGSWASVTPSVVLRLPPVDAVDLLLPDRARIEESSEPWMLRVLDAEAAIAARGWPAPVRGSADLTLAPDDLLGLPGRTCRLVVEDGAGRLEAGGSGALRLHRRGLAVLFAGFAGTAVLRRAGLLEGSDNSSAAVLDAAFAGPTPALLDYF